MGCEDRAIACHASCENYISWQKDLSKAKEFERLQKEKECQLQNYKAERHAKALRIMRNKGVIK